MTTRNAVLSPWLNLFEGLRAASLPKENRIFKLMACAFHTPRQRVAVKCPYKMLGVSRFASAKTIKHQYRVLVRKHHPDVAGAEKGKLTEVNAAYDLILRRRGLKRNMARL